MEVPPGNRAAEEIWIPTPLRSSLPISAGTTLDGLGKSPGPWHYPWRLRHEKDLKNFFQTVNFVWKVLLSSASIVTLSPDKYIGVFDERSIWNLQCENYYCDSASRRELFVLGWSTLTLKSVAVWWKIITINGPWKTWKNPNLGSEKTWIWLFESCYCWHPEITTFPRETRRKNSTINLWITRSYGIIWFFYFLNINIVCQKYNICKFKVKYLHNI